jgi:hypothetical protein
MFSWDIAYHTFRDGLCDHDDVGYPRRHRAVTLTSPIKEHRSTLDGDYSIAVVLPLTVRTLAWGGIFHPGQSSYLFGQSAKLIDRSGLGYNSQVHQLRAQVHTKIELAIAAKTPTPARQHRTTAKAMS